MSNKTSIQLGRLTITAGEDLPANRFINFSGNLCQLGQKVLGVTTRAYKAGALASVVTHGIVSIETNGTISSIGAEIRPTSDGKAESTTTAYQNIFSLDNATGSGSFIRVKL
jgi:hypothetical protein